MKRPLVSLLSLVLLLAAAPLLKADPVMINLGQSAQTYTMVGLGADNAGNGTFVNYFGACSPKNSVTECILNGAFSGNTPGFTSGYFQFVVHYDGTSGVSPVFSQTNPTFGTNYWQYANETLDTTIDLFLITDTTEVGIHILDDGAFMNGFNLEYVNPTCSGIGAAACTIGDVGLIDGAQIAGAVQGFAYFNPASTFTPTPEPGWLGLSGLPVILAAIRRRNLLGSRVD